MSANYLANCSENYFFIIEDNEVPELQQGLASLVVPTEKQYTDNEILEAVLRFYYCTARWPKTGHAVADKACGWNDFTAKFAKRFNLPSYKIILKHFGSLMACRKKAEKLAYSRNEEFYQKEIV